MSIQIRELKYSDIPNVQLLFEKDITQNEILWLYRDVYDKEKFSAFIAVDENQKIQGVIGFEKITFFIGGTKKTGIIPLSWYVDRNHRGLAGVLLLKQVFKMADLPFAIQGSGMAKKVYSIAKIVKTENAYIYRKILRLRGKNIHPLNFFSRLVAFSYAKVLIPHVNRNISLENVNNKIIYSEKPVTSGFCNIITKQKKEWLLRCPKIDYAFYFQIHRGHNIIGDAICFIKKVGRSYRGRIVHISDLNNNLSDWRSVLYLLEKELNKKGCFSVSILVKHEILLKALKRSGYIRKKEPIEIFLPQNQKDILEQPKNRWNLNYAISDKGYRGI